MKRSWLRTAAIISGIMITGMAIFANWIGFDHNPHWGTGRIITLAMGILIVICSIIVSLITSRLGRVYFLAGVIVSGQLLAVFMANAGGAWDNAKKMVEDEPRNLAANTGKGSERHKAAVVGDTVGDPLKDTAGPALNPMIKVVNLISLLAAPVIVSYQSATLVRVIVAVVLLAAIIWAISVSKKPAKIG